MIFQNLNLNSRQQGAATLIVVLVLATVMAVIALTTTRSGLMEEKIVGNDLRAREAQEAAEAGLEYGVAWAKKNSIPNTVTCSSGSLPTGCPTALTTVTGSSTHESYTYTLFFTKSTNYIKVESEAQNVVDGSVDSSIAARSETFLKQTSKELFDNSVTVMPPPWVIAGCITNAATGTPASFVLNSANNAIVTGSTADAACLPEGHLKVYPWVDTNGNGVKEDEEEWEDTNGNGVKDSGEDDESTLNRGGFTGCPNLHCAWKHVFKMSLQDAIDLATDAGHVYSGSIPCGPATSSPSIYVINNGGSINSGDISGSCSGIGIDDKTIGGPNKPIILIIPSSAGCPKFNGGITIYGIIYYETPTACASNGWGGAKVYGSVMWEGNVDKPNANSEFIEVDYGIGGDLNTVFNSGMDEAPRLPGTWKDF